MAETSSTAWPHGPRLRQGRGDRALDCWLAGAVAPRRDAPPIVAVHGISRQARQQAELLADRAGRLGRLVIAPHFDEVRWHRYQQVVRGGRSDLALLALMAELRLAGVWRTSTFDLAGYSGGAQFAHRFAMLYPNLVRRLTTCSAGWYTHPDETGFPYGLGGADRRDTGWDWRMRAGLDRFLALPIRIAVGSEDCVSDPNTRRGAVIDAQQGTDRLERAQRWASALARAAVARNLRADVAVTVLPGCGHDFAECVVRGGLDRVIMGPGEADATASATVQSPNGHTEDHACAVSSCGSLAGVQKKGTAP